MFCHQTNVYNDLYDKSGRSVLCWRHSFHGKTFSICVIEAWLNLCTPRTVYERCTFSMSHVHWATLTWIQFFGKNILFEHTLLVRVLLGVIWDTHHSRNTLSYYQHALWLQVGLIPGLHVETLFGLIRPSVGIEYSSLHGYCYKKKSLVSEGFCA